MRIIISLLLICLYGLATAAHITDKLFAGFYAEPSSEGKPIKLLPTGEPLEVLENKDDFVKVRLSDGEEGWVRAVYVSDAKPARVMLLEAQAQLTEMRKRVELLQPGASAIDIPACEPVEDTPKATEKAAECSASDLQALDDEVVELKQRIQKAAEALQVSLPDSKVASSNPLVETAEKAMEQDMMGIPLFFWGIGIILLSLVVGVFIGVRIMLRRIHHRYGRGFSI